MSKVEVIFYWLAVLLYAGSLFMSAVKIIWKKEQGRLDLYLATAGFLAHTAALLYRWYRVGHGPYVDFAEVVPADAWAGMAGFLWFCYYKPRFRTLLLFVAPATMLALGAAVLNSDQMESIPLTYRSFWLYLHVLFAKLAYGSALLAAGTGAYYLLHKRKGNNVAEVDDLTYRFLALAFLMLAIMMITGALWANQSWGRYWAWDPVETWAMISWLIYGLVLHLRFTYGWRGEKAAWLAIGAFVLIIFAYFGVPYIYQSIHEHLK